MGALTVGPLAARAVVRVHVLVLPVPGRPLLRLRVEAAVRRRGWVQVAAPADADALLVCGVAEGRVAAAAGGLRDRLVAPRAVHAIDDAAAVEAALDEVARSLAEGGRREEAADGTVREGAPATETIPTGASAAGVARLRLGPVLPDWPAGLVVQVELAEGRIAAARARLLPAPAAEEDDPASPAAAGLALACDEAARLLRLAGWPAPARRLARVQDRVLAGEPPEQHGRALRSTTRRVRRSLAFAWTADPAVRRRVLEHLAAAERAAAGAPVEAAAPDLGAVGAALVGASPAQAALLVAAVWSTAVTGA